MKVFVMAAVAGGFVALLPSVRVVAPSHSFPSVEPRVVVESTTTPKPHAPRKASATRTSISNSALTQIVRQTCAASCHSEQRKLGSLSLEQFDVSAVTGSGANTDVAERMINKLRTGMMPPPGRKRPGGDTLTVLASPLET